MNTITASYHLIVHHIHTLIYVDRYSLVYSSVTWSNMFAKKNKKNTHWKILRYYFTNKSYVGAVAKPEWDRQSFVMHLKGLLTHVKT